MHDEYVEDPDPDKEDCKVEDDDPKDVCKDKPTGVEEGGPEEEQPKPDSDGAFKPDEEKPDGDGGGDEPDEGEPGTDPVFVPVVGQDCKEGWYYDDDLDRCVDMRCDPNNLEFYDAAECCKSGQAGDGYVDRLCRDICDPEAEGYDVDMCCDLESPWYDAERCEVEVEPVIEPVDPEGDGDPDELETDPVEQPVVIDPGAVSKCSSYINDGALEGLPDGASAEETKMFDLINAYRVSKGLSKWEWSPELHLACTAVGLFKLGAENTPDYENDYDKTRFGSLQELVMYYGYHNPVGPEYKYYKGPKPDADFIWGQTIDPTGMWGLKRALDALPGYVDCAVALVKNKSWVWMTAKGNECKEEDEEDPDEIDPDEVIDGGDELFDPAIVGTECDKDGARYNAEWVWDETDKKCKGPDESKPEVEDPDEIDPDEVIDGGDEIFEPATEIGTKCDPTNPEYDDTLEWDPDAKECRKKEGVGETVEPEPVDKPDTYTAGASLPPGAVNPIFGTECDQREGNDKYDPSFEWNQATKECKKRKEPEPEVEPETPTVEPTGPPCMDITANNFYKPGPCTYNPTPEVEQQPVTEPPVTEPPVVKPDVIPYSEIPCYDEDLGGWVRCAKDDVDVLNDDDGDFDDDGVLDDVDPDDDGDLVPDTEDVEPFIPDTPVEPVVDPEPPVVQSDEGVAEFLGAKVVGKRFAFILDHSGSMRGGIVDGELEVAAVEFQRWTILVNHVEKTLNNLPDDAAIWIGCFAGELGDPIPVGWARDLIFPGGWTTAGNRVKIVAWLRAVICDGATDPMYIISKCFKSSGSNPELDPDVIFMLSDGKFTVDKEAVVKHFAKYNVTLRKRAGLSPILTHTFTIVNDGGKSELIQIAGVTNVAMGFPRWGNHPCTYRHLSYDALQDLPV